MITGGANIPVAILLGAQKGMVEAALKDRKDYADMLATIQKAVLAPALTEIIKKFQTSGQPPQDEFLINWSLPSISLIDVARGHLYDARAETEAAKAEHERAQARCWHVTHCKGPPTYRKVKRKRRGRSDRSGREEG